MRMLASERSARSLAFRARSPAVHLCSDGATAYSSDTDRWRSTCCETSGSNTLRIPRRSTAALAAAVILAVAPPSFAVEDDVAGHAAAAPARGRHLAGGSAVAGLPRRSRVPLHDRPLEHALGRARPRRRDVLGARLQRGHGWTGRHHSRAAGVHVPQQPRLRSVAPPAGVRRLEVAHHPVVHVVAGPARDRVSRRLRHAAPGQRAALAHHAGAQPQSDRRVGRRASSGEHPLREAVRARQADEAALHQGRLRPAAAGRGERLLRRRVTQAGARTVRAACRDRTPPRTSSPTRREGSSPATGW